MCVGVDTSYVDEVAVPALTAYGHTGLSNLFAVEKAFENSTTTVDTKASIVLTWRNFQSLHAYQQTNPRISGEFQAGEIHGQGTYYFNDKSVYEGELIDGYFHGKGTYRYADCDLCRFVLPLERSGTTRGIKEANTERRAPCKGGYGRGG